LGSTQALEISSTTTLFILGLVVNKSEQIFLLLLVLTCKKYGAIDNFEKDETEGERSEIVNVVSLLSSFNSAVSVSFPLHIELALLSVKCS